MRINMEELMMDDVVMKYKIFNFLSIKNNWKRVAVLGNSISWSVVELQHEFFGQRVIVIVLWVRLRAPVPIVVLVRLLEAKAADKDE